MMACEVMYLAACILTGQTEYVRVTEAESFRQEKLTIRGSRKIGYIRNVDPVAYAYLVKSFQLLQSAGYFTESIL